MITDAAFEYKVFFLVLLFGLLSGVVYGIFNMIVLSFKKNIIIKNISDGIFMLIFASIFFYCLNAYNFGTFRVYLLITYIIGFIIERKTIGKLFAKLFLLVYNYNIKLIKKFKKSKAGAFLFK